MPYTGIIDYVAVAKKYGDKIEDFGGLISLNTKVSKIVEAGSTSKIMTNKGDFKTKLVINCAGLYSDKLAIETAEDVDLKIIPFRGEYFKLVPEKEYLVKHLIYPVPDPNFLSLAFILRE